MADISDLILWFCLLLPCAYLFRIVSRKTSKLPPGPVGFPVVGSLFQLGDMPNESLAKLSKLYGPLMALRLGFKTTVVVSSPEMAREILHKQDQAFSGRILMDIANNQFDYPKYSLVFNQSDVKWRELRRICSNELFTPKRLDELRAVREQKVRALLQHIRAELAAGRPVDIGDRVFATILNTVSNTLFSQDVVDLGSDSAAGEFKSIVWGMLEAGGKPNLADFFPALRPFDPQGLRRQNDVLVKRLYAVFDEVIDRRLQSFAATDGRGNGGEGDDFLNVLLELGGKPGSEFNRLAVNAVLGDLPEHFTARRLLLPWTPLLRTEELHRYLRLHPESSTIPANSIAGVWTSALKLLGCSVRPWHLKDLFVAGSDTSSNTIEWAMTELLRHPEKLTKAQSELRRTIGVDRFVTESDIPQLPYFEGVVKETLRLHPPAPLLLPHRAEATTEVAGFTIPKHTQVLVNVWAIGRDPAYWENPTSFLPERFIQSDINFKGKNFSFIPFGAGRRMCPGMPLAVRMVHLVLASLIHSFTWELPDGMTPEQLGVEAKFGISLRKAVPLTVLGSPSIDM